MPMFSIFGDIQAFLFPVEYNIDLKNLFSHYLCIHYLNTGKRGRRSLKFDSGAGLCWQHVGGVGSTTTTRSLKHM